MWEDIAVMVVISLGILTVGAVIIFRGPVGKALADRVAGRGSPEGGDWEHLRAELDELRGQLADVHERLDFAERMLAQQREPGRLRGGTA